MKAFGARTVCEHPTGRPPNAYLRRSKIAHLSPAPSAADGHAARRTERRVAAPPIWRREVSLVVSGSGDRWGHDDLGSETAGDEALPMDQLDQLPDPTKRRRGADGDLRVQINTSLPMPAPNGAERFMIGTGACEALRGIVQNSLSSTSGDRHNSADGPVHIRR